MEMNTNTTTALDKCAQFVAAGGCLDDVLLTDEFDEVCPLAEAWDELDPEMDLDVFLARVVELANG